VALSDRNYEHGRFLDLKTAQVQSGWTLGEPAWASLPGKTRKQFVGIPMLWADKPAASLVLPFEGSALGMFLVSGPDAGIVEYSIDRSPTKTIDLFTKHSGGLHYPWTCMFASDLAAGPHKLSLRVSDQKNPASKGMAVRIKTFVANSAN
jgi:sialidase-1